MFCYWRFRGHGNSLQTEMLCKNPFQKKKEKKKKEAVLVLWSYALKDTCEEVQFSKVASLEPFNLIKNKLFTLIFWKFWPKLQNGYFKEILSLAASKTIYFL